MPRISIIIPIYNVEDYLVECLESVKAQAFADFEALCVIDGATDGSGAIAEQYAAADGRFRVLTKENGGLSSARNFGIAHATGDIVMFLDADDAIEAGCCERIVRAFSETDADALVFGASVMPLEAATPWFDQALTPEPGVFTGMPPELVFSEWATPFVWRNAVSRQLLEREGLRFDEELPFGEDLAFQFALYPRARTVASIPDKLYRYRLARAGSLMDAHRGDAERLAAHADMLALIFADWSARSLIEPYARELFEWSVPYLLRDVDRLPAQDRADHVAKVNALWDEYFPAGVRPIQAKTECLCRGEGKAYVLCRVRSIAPFSELAVTAHAAGAPVPANAYSYAGEGADQAWVLELPLLATPSIDVELMPDGRACERARMSWSFAKAKWLSRLNYRVKPGQCASIRDYERSFSWRRYQLEAHRRFDAGSEAVWRVCVRWAGAGSHRPQIRVADARGAGLSAEVFFFEFQQAVDELGENRLFLSVKLPAECDHFVLIAEDGAMRDAGDQVRSGFAVVDAAAAESLRASTRDFVKSAGDDDEAYRRWLAGQRPRAGDLEAQRAVSARGDGPLFSIVAYGLTGEGSHLAETVDSVLRQTYGRWELIVAGSLAGELPVSDERIRGVGDGGPCAAESGAAAAKGDYVAFLAFGDVLEPDALFSYAQVIGKAQGADGAPEVLFCDEDVIAPDGSYGQPSLKSKLNLDLLYCWNWAGHFLVVKGDLLRALEPCEPGARAAWEYDRVLRAWERKARFEHVGRVLYHARGRQADAGAMRTALEGHLRRRGIAGQVEDAPVPGRLRIRYDLPDSQPLVSIIIPSKDHPDLLEACIRSIVEKSSYANYEILIIENNSVEDATFACYERLEREYGRVRVVRWPAEFNFSKIVNFGAQRAAGDYLLLLNNDTELIEPGSIAEMVGLLQRPEVGVVGAKLLFADGLVQHAGALVGVGDAIAHVNQNRTADDGGYLDRACLPGDFTAVTGACQMVRAEVFRQVGGYDEGFAVGFNDIDFCMRVQENGYLVAYTPYALWRHYEFVSRGREEGNDELMLRWKREQAQFIQKWPAPFVTGDPYTGPNLMRHNFYYRLP